MKFDCIIIGSGLAAIWSAKFLNEKGLSPLMIQKIKYGIGTVFMPKVELQLQMMKMMFLHI